ncbi:MAG: hypothetical protein JXQ75_19795 [Phycisphaerae bacterium]|nr:hypothetical protein [Phycisphaerae bacterium]
MEPHPDEPRRRYGLDQILRVIGVPATFEPQPHTTIYCGSDPQVGGAAAIWISIDESSRFRDRPPRVVEMDGVPIPIRGPQPTSLWTGNRLAFDVALAATFWLTLESERYAAQRDAHGRVPAPASLLAAGGLLDRPPIHAYAQLLADRLMSCGACTQAKVAPRWPSGKRYAVALSHDVDAPEVRSRVPSLLTELALGGGRSRRQTYWDLREEISAPGFRDTCLTPPARRRQWDFAKLCALEQQHGFRSALYFSVVNRRVGHHCDVPYDAARARYGRLYRRLLTGGWEVGLHAAYLTYAGRPSAEAQYSRLAELTGRPIAGVRHHYLQLAARDPLRTLLAHAAAGALYDTTVGFNDRPGFRPGVALPFQPYGTETGAAGSFVELPMSIADMHLPRHDQAAAIDMVVKHLETVRAIGGLAVLNWHVGNWHAAPAWRESYRTACRLLADDPEAWVALPRDIAARWGRRTETLHGAFAV